MNDYVEVRLDLDPCNETMTDVMAACLADIGFESFVADHTGLTAYVRAADYDAEALASAIENYPLPATIDYQAVTIEGRDWNHEWERHYFRPIVVGDQVAIHSSFHTDVPKAEYDIVIDPKMAFGTGHHSTTSLMIRRLLAADLRGKSVIDMGTGTAILAILAAMRGASPVVGIEIDEMAWVNARENAALNGHSEIDLRHGDAALLADFKQSADYFLANINRNVITADIGDYVATLRRGATVFFSGFYVDDIPVIEHAAAPLGLRTVDYTDDNRWACLRMVFD